MGHLVARPIAATAAALFLGCAPAPGAGVAPAREAPVAAYDIVIEGGLVVDGTGASWYQGDIGIRGERIARIAPPGMLRDVPARERVDALGMVVAPGFIDIQGHSREAFLAGDPDAAQPTYQRAFFLTSSRAAWRISTFIPFLPTRRSSSQMRCCAARSSLAGTTSSFAATAVTLPPVDQMLPPPDDGLIDRYLMTQLRDRELSAPDACELLPFKLGAEGPPSVRTPPVCFHWIALL